METRRRFGTAVASRQTTSTRSWPECGNFRFVIKTAKELANLVELDRQKAGEPLMEFVFAG